LSAKQALDQSHITQDTSR